MAGRARTVVLAVLVVVAVLAAGVWWFVLRDDAPAKAALHGCAGQPASAAGPSTPDGPWSAKPAATDFAGYRVQELFGGATVKRTATGRTHDVTGTLDVSGRTVKAATISVKTGTLSSDRTARDSYIKTHGLDTDDFPTATFTLAKPIALPAAPTRGQVVKATAAGTLGLHGKELPVSVPIDACWNGTTIHISGSIPVQLADYGIDVLSTPIVKIDDHGTLEFQLTFAPS